MILENMARSGAKVCIYIGKPEADLVCSLYLLYVSKKRGYIYVLKLVPTVPGNGQKAGNHERGCMSKHFRVPTLLSTLQNAPLPKNTEFGSSKQAAQLSPRAALHALCFTSTYLSKYGSFRCKIRKLQLQKYVYRHIQALVAVE